jgi:hypothetical protein
VDQQWSSCGLSYASLPESRAILLDGPPPATTQRRIAKVLDQAELAWFDALAATTIAELIENASDASLTARRWLGARARLGLAPAT